MKNLIAWIERNKWIVIAVLVCATAIAIAYIMRPSRFHVMGEHNNYIFDVQTGEAFYANGRPVKPLPPLKTQKNETPPRSDFDFFEKALKDRK